jgi:hypothetical protein
MIFGKVQARTVAGADITARDGDPADFGWHRRDLNGLAAGGRSW